MTKYLNKIICVAIAVMIASPASAAITSMERFKPGLFNYMYFGSTNMGGGIIIEDYCVGPKCTIDYGLCGASNAMSSIPAGMECESFRAKDGKTTCFRNCHCSTEKFPFAVAAEDREKFVLPTSKADMCTDPDGTTYYASAACAAGYHSKTNLDKYPMSMWFNYGTPVVATNRKSSSLSVSCYNPKDLTCGGTKGTRKIDPADIREVGSVGSVGSSVKVFPKGEPIRYYVKTFATTADEILAGTYPACVTPGYEDVTTIDNVSFSAVPTKASCAEYVEATAKYLPGFKYYYYNGNCMDNGLCTTSTSDCVDYASETFTSYNPSANSTGNGSCRKISGCKTGWDDEGKYFCAWAQSGESVVPTGIAHTTVHSEQALHDDCIKVTGCATGYAPIAFREGTYGTEVNDVTKGYNASNIVSFTSPQDPNDDTFGMAVCEKTVPCTVGTYYNEETKACTTSKEGGRKYYVTGTTSGGKCTVMGIPNTYGKGNIAYTIDWANGGSSSPSTTASAALESAKEHCHQMAGSYEFNYGIASYADYIHWMKTENSNLWYDENESSPAPTIITDDGLGIDAYQGYVAYLRPDTAPGDLNGENFQYYCKMTVDCGSTANSSVPTDIVAPGKWYDSTSKKVSTSGDMFIVTTNTSTSVGNSTNFEAVFMNSLYSKFMTSKLSESAARTEASQICTANGGMLITKEDLSLIMTDSAGVLTEGGDDGTTVANDGCYSYTNNCGTTTKYNVVCKYNANIGSGLPFVGSPNSSCSAGQYYNSSTDRCSSTATDWIVVSNGAKGLKLAYVGGGYVTPSQYTANVSSAQTYGFDSCVNNEFDGLLTTSEMESLGADVINSFTSKLGQAGMNMGGNDIYFVVSDGQKCVDVGILGADSYYCPADYYSVMCQVTLTPTKTTLPDVAPAEPVIACEFGKYYDLANNSCSDTSQDSGGEEEYFVLGTSSGNCTITGASMATPASIARVVDWANGGTSIVVTNREEARTAGEEGCQNQYGGTLLTTNEVAFLARSRGLTGPYEASGLVSGIVVTSDGCFDLTTNTTGCSQTQTDFAYACKFSTSCNATTTTSLSANLTCERNTYLLSTGKCTVTENGSNDPHLVISKSGNTCVVSGVYTPGNVARIVNADGTGSTPATTLATARTAAQQGCQDQYGGSLLSTNEARSVGGIPFENSGFTTGYVVTSNGCWNLNDNSTTTCPSTAADYAYACKYSTTCN